MTIKRVYGAVGVAVGLALALPVAAQTMSPSWDPVMAGQGMVLRDMNKAQTQRLRNRSYGNTYSRDGYAPRRASNASGCSDYASLRSRVGSLSRDEYMRYRACQGRAD